MPADPSALKRKVIAFIEGGATVEVAMGKVARSVKTYESWRKLDSEFRESVDHARDLLDAKRRGEVRDVPDFPEFAEKYLHHRLFLHQLQWFDILEGHEPRDLHYAETYEPGKRSRVVLNTPVEHGKSSTISMDYVTWMICKNPNIRVMIISKSQTMARKFLLGIKSRLTNPMYREMQKAFSPEGGWKSTASVWTANMIYLGGDRDSGEKDPTVEALGIGGHIYGARADLIIMDDCVVNANAHEYDKQIDWIQAEVQTRVRAGRLLIVGTRMAANDLYSEIVKDERYTNGKSPWTYLAQPAVLEYADDPEDWKTLWPRNTIPCECLDFCNEGNLEPGPDGLFDRWDGKHLNDARNSVDPATWARVYMQAQLTEDAVFNEHAVRAAIDGQRQCGVMRAGGLGHRPLGMEGLYIVAGLDPAMTENTAALVMGVDRRSGERWVLDVFDQRQVSPLQMRQLIKDWTEEYHIQEWRIEKNAFQIMLTQDQEINQFLANHGCVLREHYTGKNKWDNDFGVASVSPIFGVHTEVHTEKGGLTHRVEGGLIHLPSTKQSEAPKRLVEQLITWAPDTKNKTDMVMALWFCEIRAREIVNAYGSNVTHLNNKFLGRRRLRERITINLDDAYEAESADRVAIRL